MAYIGNDLRSNEDYKIIDDISSGFNGSATSFALQVGGATPVPFPKFEQQLLISVNGVIQEPDPTGSAGFKLSGTNIVFSSAPTNGHAFFGVIYAGADYVNAGGTFPDGSINFPSITFSADTNTGFTRTASGTVALISDGTKVAQFPTSQGSSGQALITDGGGNLSFGVPTAAFTDITLADSIIHSGDTNTKIKFPAADTVSVETAGSERLRVDSSGRVGIGTIAPSELLTINGADKSALIRTSNGIGTAKLKFEADGTNYAGIGLENTALVFRCSNNSSPTERMRITSDGPHLLLGGTSDVNEITESSANAGMVIGGTGFGNAGLAIITSTSGTGRLYFGDDVGSNAGRNRGQINYGHSDDHMRFVTASGERMRIDSSGNVGIGATTIANDSGHAKLAISGTSGNNAGILVFQDSSNNEDGAIFSDNASLFIVADRDNTTASSNIVFRVDGSSEKMRIDSSGNVGLGVTSISDARFRIKGANNNTGAFNDGLMVESNNSSVFKKYSWMGIETQGGIHFSEVSGGVGETMRIDSAGRVSIGVTSASERLIVQTTANTMVPMAINDSSNTATLTHRISFRTGGAEIGSIKSTNSSTQFNQSSDYRLKENAVAISDGITRLKTLKPYRFNFIIDASKTVDGFFAHEVTAVPEAVDGVKDEVATQDHVNMGLAKKIGDPIYQGIDQSKLVPLLTAALQEAIAKVEVLETKVAALEAA